MTMTELACETMLAQIRECLVHAHKARDFPDDPEGVHQMRVYSRRLRSSLQAYRPVLPRDAGKGWRKSVRKITKGLGDARDADVQMIWLNKLLGKLEDPKLRPGIERLLLRTEQHREQYQDDVDKIVHLIVDEQMLEPIAQTLRTQQVAVRLGSDCGAADVPLFDHAGQRILLNLEEMLSFEPLPVRSHEAEILHEMRIAGKRLRYTVEAFQSAYNGALDGVHKKLKKIQDTLGDIHDCDVWIERLPIFVKNEKQRTEEYFGHLRNFKRLQHGLDWLLEQQIAEREDLAQKFAKQWRQATEEGVWDELRNVVYQMKHDSGLAAKNTKTQPNAKPTSAKPSEPAAEPTTPKPAPNVEEENDAPQA